MHVDAQQAENRRWTDVQLNMMVFIAIYMQVINRYVRWVFNIMVKHTQTIRWEKPTNCLSVLDHFVGLAFKWLRSSIDSQECKALQIFNIGLKRLSFVVISSTLNLSYCLEDSLSILHKFQHAWIPWPYPLKSLKPISFFLGFLFLDYIADKRILQHDWVRIKQMKGAIKTLLSDLKWMNLPSFSIPINPPICKLFQGF